MSGHIVFDFDGTLVSTMDSIFYGMKQILEAHLQREISAEEMKKNFDHHPDVTLKNFDIDPAIHSQKLIGDWMRLVEVQKPQHLLFKGIRTMLTNLKERGHTLYVWTARDRSSTLKILQDLDLADYFQDVRTSSDGETKPHPQGILEMVGSLPKNKVVMIGDSYVDVLGAKNFGCKAIGVTWCNFSKESLLTDSGADFLATSPVECEGHLQTYFEGQVHV